MLGEVEKNLKKAEFINSLISEKTENIGNLEKKLAAYRKKNGKDAELDVYIYQTNMKIAAEKKDVADYKREVKNLKDKCGEILLEEFASERAYRAKAKIRERFSEIYDGKAKIVDDEEEKSVLAAFGVATKDKRLRGTSALLIKPGVKTNMGKLVKKPEIALYEYAPKKEEGEKILLNYPREAYLQDKNEIDKYKAVKEFISENALIGGFIALITALSLTYNLAFSGGVSIALSVVFAALLSAYFLFTYKNKENKIPTVTLISGGITLLSSLINFSWGKIAFPISLCLCGAVWTAISKRAEKTKKNGEVFFIPFGAAFGLIFGVFLSDLISFGSAWTVTVISLTALSGVSLSFIKNPKREETDAFDFWACFCFAAFISLSFGLGGYLKAAALFFGLAGGASETVRAANKKWR